MIKRPDDAAGIGFARQLAALRARVAKRCSQLVTIERLEWLMDWVAPCCEIDKSIAAYPAGYYLTTFELKESFLETQGDDAPRISWVVYKGRGYRTLVMGGQAPTLLVGQARAEAIWRIDAGVRSDA